MHHPVLLQEVLDNLNVKKDGLYIDATLGEGGYTLAMLDKGGKVLALDWDSQQISNFEFLISKQIPIPKTQNLTVKQGNFKDIEKIAKENNFYPVDGIVFDLGLSMRQINESGRGFSYKKIHEPLDMRLNTQEEETATDLVNSLNKEGLYDLFASYSEELKSQIIANNIVEKRIKRRIKTVGDFLAVIDKAVGEKDSRVYRRIFQALRIAVNHEFDNLRTGLAGALHLIKKDGRIAVVTFHSLEDRIVKQLGGSHLIKGNRHLQFERSAKLRIIGGNKND